MIIQYYYPQTMAKHKEHKKETLLHKLMVAAFSSIVMATAAGIIGYKLNTKLPDLYYQIERPIPVASGFQFNTIVENKGRAAATDMIVRYTFNRMIVDYDYNYSEGLNGKLPSANVVGGIGQKEVLLLVPRLLPEDTLEAQFVFYTPNLESRIKVFSKEVMGRPLSEWQEKINQREEILHRIKVAADSIVYRINKDKIRSRFIPQK